MEGKESGQRTRTVGVLLFEGFEPLDVFGPVEAFIAARFRDTGDEPPHPFRVVTIAQGKEPVAMTGGVRALPDFDFPGAPALDILLVPGGMGTRREYRNDVILEFIRRAADSTEIVASVCTGAALLAAAGLLDGRRATTNRRAFDWVASTRPEVLWDRAPRWVDEGRIVTSAGVSAGTDMALHLVRRLLGDDAAEGAATRMEYRWDPDPLG